jgi:hypothetical protein
MWALLLVLAVLWPGRIVGPLAGIPFDKRVDVLVAAVLPVLWVLAPAFLNTRRARIVIGGLLVWKVAAWLLLTQTGLCATFLADPNGAGGMVIQPSWDTRALWSLQGRCSAVFARPYRELEEFPAWTINLLPEAVRPPAGSFALDVRGVVETPRRSELTVDMADASVVGTVDGEAFGNTASPRVLEAGAHRVDLRVLLRGVHWRFVPELNGRSLFDVARTYVSTPSRLDVLLGGLSAWVTPAFVIALLALWGAYAVSLLQPSLPILGWSVGAAAVAFAIGASVEPPLVRYSMLLLFSAVAIPVQPRVWTLRTAFMLVAVPWLAFFAGRSLHDLGRLTVYTMGDDWWTFQRHAYRIFIEGFWLEGGEKTFWNQPLYRWIAGTLHLLFGDSSAGEMYLDAFGVAVGAMFAFDVVSRLAGFRIGLVAAIVVLNVTMLGPNWYGIGRGLSEIVAASCVYLAAFALRESRHRTAAYAAIAGLWAAVAFFTRLNHLLLLVAMVVLLLPDEVEAGSVFRVRDLWRRLPKTAAAVYLTCVFSAVVAIAARTWYYTSHFSLFLGTQRDLVSTGLGLSTMFSRVAWVRALESVAMVATVQDPPRLDIRVIGVTAGVLCAVCGLLGMPIVRRLPLGLAGFCAGAIAGGFIVRGSAYAGRFSVHVVPVAIPVAIASLTLAFGQRRHTEEVHI